MSQNKQEQAPIQLGKMIFFQNLVPGLQESPLVNRFRSECLDKENDESLKKQREALLMEFPPILSFVSKKQKEQFYEQEAMNCKQFCCGGMTPISSSFVSDIIFTPKDDYVFSPGNGQLYEGSQKAIGNTIKEDMNQEQFGSPSQKALMDGLAGFDKTVTERTRSSATVEIESPSLTEVKSPNPFDMTFKPKDQ
ncbi:MULTISPECIES: hypothetical protein [Legionella]|uniref:Substrate of the Dot/Icm secretion system n=1 Tax=Legionella resiliens TaxID=2905958 RepID=A0ABS8X4M2_9GAMM|nr:MULTISPECIES: hypothetical protein [unclassified Legionella]MCE0723757.1 hypothetical protein [Legionella sp. 9fVS26]MCE3532909.1 hypothetical protein [Legionella sp. 8cVS16]QLZ69097.1 hypothetical protein FOLKNPGA_01879 [Legionella sp. PC1000]